MKENDRSLGANPIDVGRVKKVVAQEQDGAFFSRWALSESSEFFLMACGILRDSRGFVSLCDKPRRFAAVESVCVWAFENQSFKKRTETINSICFQRFVALWIGRQFLRVADCLLNYFKIVDVKRCQARVLRKQRLFICDPTGHFPIVFASISFSDSSAPFLILEVFMAETVSLICCIAAVFPRR